MKPGVFKTSFVIILLLAIFPAWSQIKDEAVIRVFTVLREKNEEGYLKLFPDAAATVKFLEKLLLKNSTGDDDVNGIKLFLKNISDSGLREDYRRDYRDIIKKGERKGIDWNHMKLVSYTVDSLIDTETKTSRLSGKIYFNEEMKEYFMAYDQVLRFDEQGWYGVRIERIDERTKEHEPEEYDMYDNDADTIIIPDSTVMVMDSAAKVDTRPEPLIKAPVKQPSEKKPPKTKSKSPASKDN